MTKQELTDALREVIDEGVTSPELYGTATGDPNVIYVEGELHLDAIAVAVMEKLAPNNHSGGNT